MIFTRYLYNADEVLLTLLEGLLTRKTLEECYFWCYEYYSSGFMEETWQFIYKIYYDFYKLGFPKFERKIHLFYKNWKKNNDFINIMHVIKNLHKCKINISPTIFLLRRFYSTKLVRIFKNPKNVEKYEKHENICKNRYEKLLLRSLCEKCFYSISYYLRKTMDEPNQINIIETYLERKIKISKNYDPFVQILTQILPHLDDSKWYFHKENAKSINEILKTDKIADTTYKTLPKNRKYSISNTIGCFKLDRENYKLNEMYWYNWEYFAYKSPLWKKRFDKYSIKLDHEKKSIEFNDDDEMEDFYEKYGFEPDEQSYENQQKSIMNIPIIKLKVWLKEVFNYNFNRVSQIIY